VPASHPGAGVALHERGLWPARAAQWI